jgi:hypothetical protein
MKAYFRNQVTSKTNSTLTLTKNLNINDKQIDDYRKTSACSGDNNSIYFNQFINNSNVLFSDKHNNLNVINQNNDDSFKLFPDFENLDCESNYTLFDTKNIFKIDFDYNDFNCNGSGTGFLDNRECDKFDFFQL